MLKSKENIYVFKQLDKNSGRIFPASALNLFKNTIFTSVVGPSNSGKTIAVKLIIASIIRNSNYQDSDIVLIDPKNFEYKEFSGRKGVYLGDNAVEGLEYVYEEFEKRLLNNEEKAPLLIFFIEEFSALIMSLAHDKKKQEEVQTRLNRLLSMSRALNVRGFFIMQRFDSLYFGKGGSRDNITTRLAFGRISKEAQKMLFPDEGVKSLPIRHGYMLQDGKELEQIVVPTVRKFKKLDSDIKDFLDRK
ncbi:hypothetical protein [Enterococcus sp. LJL90]